MIIHNSYLFRTTMEISVLHVFYTFCVILGLVSCFSVVLFNVRHNLTAKVDYFQLQACFAL